VISIETALKDYGVVVSARARSTKWRPRRHVPAALSNWRSYLDAALSAAAVLAELRKLRKPVPLPILAVSDRQRRNLWLKTVVAGWDVQSKA